MLYHLQFLAKAWGPLRLFSSHTFLACFGAALAALLAPVLDWTAATPDGRKKGEEMSKNLSPTMGADTEGATALVATLASSDATKLPGDYPLDVMLHPSVCAGRKGLDVMRMLVQFYHKNGGSVIQFTVFSAEELRDAQAHPEKYENLQVRICGWNVRWNDLSRTEQDAYIRRAENVMQAF